MRNHRQGAQAEAGGCRRNPAEADGGHITAWSALVSSILVSFLTFPAFRFSKSSSCDSGGKIYELREITARAPRRNLADAGGTPRKLTGAISPPIPASLFHFGCRF